MAECSVARCLKPVLARGWCRTHYRRWMKTGSLNRPPRPAPRTCQVEGCSRRHKTRGLCALHHRSRPPSETDPVCSVVGCDRARLWVRLGLCGLHAARMRTHGSPLIVRPPGDPKMVRCAACNHPAAAVIDGCLMQGDSRRAVASWTGLSSDQIERHAREHLSLPSRPGTRCTVCAHPDMDEIEDALSETSRPIVAAAYGLTISMVNKHKDRHMTEQWKAREAAFEIQRLAVVKRLIR